MTCSSSSPSLSASPTLIPGAGIFQPYRGTARIMFGDGKVSESDAVYHWGYWANEEIALGKNVTVEKDGKGKKGKLFRTLRKSRRCFCDADDPRTGPAGGSSGSRPQK